MCFFITCDCILQPSVTRQSVFFWIFLRLCNAFEDPQAMDDTTIKSNLEKKRNELGLSQTEMARRLEISLNAYRKLEKGKTRILNEHVEKFAEKTGTSVAELVNGFEPIDSVSVGLNDVKETCDKKLRVLEDGYLKEIAVLRAEIERLNDKLKDKDEILSINRRLIRRYEADLKLKGGE